jgi:hypothetical protein
MSDQYTPTIVGTNAPSTGAARPAITLLPKSGSLAGQERRFTQDLVTFGRAADNDLPFDNVRDAKVSTYHGRLIYDSAYQCWVVEDLRSTNGTFINGHRLSEQPARLQSGDLLVLGDPSDPASVVIDVEIEGQAPPSPPVGSTSSADLPGTHVPAPESAPPQEEEGFFGRLKGKYRRWNERREVSREIEQATANLDAMKKRHVAVYAELGRQLVETGALGQPDVSVLATTPVIVGLQDAIAGKQREIAGIREMIGSLEQSLQTWLGEWQGRFDADEQVRVQATAALETAKSENVAADAALRELLASRASGMKQVGQQLVQAAAQVESVPESATNEHLQSLGQSTAELAALLNQPLHELPGAIERLVTSRARVSEAEKSLAEATRQVESRKSERSAREAEHKSAVDAKNREIAQVETSIGSLQQQIVGKHLSLGQEATQKAAAGQLSVQLPAVNAALNAVAEQKAQEQKIAELQRRLAELSQ